MSVKRIVPDIKSKDLDASRRFYVEVLGLEVAMVEVADIDDVHSRAVSRGLQIMYPLTNGPWGVRRFFVTDPNGTVINVMSHLERTKIRKRHD